MISVRALLTILLLASASWAPPRADAAPDVAVSIAPVHSLVAAIMEGAGRPELLVPPGTSPHGFALRPSDMRSLHAADLVIWIGESLERFLAKPLTTLDETTARLSVAQLPGLELLLARRGGDWSYAQHGHMAQGHGIDPHLWLSPANARVIVRQVAERLAELDPAHVQRYRANAEAVLRRLEELDARLSRKLAPVKERSYLVYHDAYQYFEEHYGLSPAGSITTSPEVRPGARRITELRETIEARNVGCVFSEPQFTPALVQTVLEDTGARQGMLDAEGADIPPAPMPISC